MASVLRRVQSCSTDPPSFNDLKHPGKQLPEHLAETVGIKEDDILKEMKVTLPIFSYAQEKNLTESQMEQREGESAKKEESKKKREKCLEGGKSDEKNIEKDKKGNCRETTKEKQQEMTGEASEPTKEQDGDNTIVSVDHEWDVSSAG